MFKELTPNVETLLHRFVDYARLYYVYRTVASQNAPEVLVDAANQRCEAAKGEFYSFMLENFSPELAEHGNDLDGVLREYGFAVGELPDIGYCLLRLNPPVERTVDGATYKFYIGNSDDESVTVGLYQNRASSSDTLFLCNKGNELFADRTALFQLMEDIDLREVFDCSSRPVELYADRELSLSEIMHVRFVAEKVDEQIKQRGKSADDICSGAAESCTQEVLELKLFHEYPYIVRDESFEQYLKALKDQVMHRFSFETLHWYTDENEDVNRVRAGQTLLAKLKESGHDGRFLVSAGKEDVERAVKEAAKRILGLR